MLINMKKLLLVLFISLGIVGSVNANSIKGAFGYKLGDVDKSIETEEFKIGSWSYFATKYFTPSSPLPFFSSYSASATPISHKIYEIKAATHLDGKFEGITNDYCSYSDTHFSNLLAMLEARYGDFEVRTNKRESGNYSSGVRWTRQTYNLEYTDGNRSIYLHCYQTVGSNIYYDLQLIYRDSDLDKLEDKEYDYLVDKKILEESSDYDL
jgi:hypothetical protein